MIVAVTWILFCFHPELQRQWASQECSWLWVQRAIPSVHLSLTACRYRDPVKLFNMSKWVCFHMPFVSINWWNKKVCMYFQLSYTIYVHVWVWPNQQWFNWVMCWLNHQNTKGKNDAHWIVQAITYTIGPVDMEVGPTNKGLSVLFRQYIRVIRHEAALELNWTWCSSKWPVKCSWYIHLLMINICLWQTCEILQGS